MLPWAFFSEVNFIRSFLSLATKSSNLWQIWNHKTERMQAKIQWLKRWIASGISRMTAPAMKDIEQDQSTGCSLTLCPQTSRLFCVPLRKACGRFTVPQSTCLCKQSFRYSFCRMKPNQRCPQVFVAWYIHFGYSAGILRAPNNHYQVVWWRQCFEACLHIHPTNGCLP